MKKCKFNWQTLYVVMILTAGWQLASTSACAGVIQIDFDSDPTASGWNPVDANIVSTPLTLFDENGVNTSVSLTDVGLSGHSITGISTTGISGGDPSNGVLLPEIGDDGAWFRTSSTGDPGTITLTFDGLDPTITYTIEIYSYSLRFSNPTDLDVTLFADTIFQGVDDDSDPQPLVFQNVSFSSGFADFIFQTTDTDPSHSTTLNAIRIIPIPEPASVFLMLAGGGALLLRRRSSFKY